MYVVGVVDVPPKSLVVITPVDEFKVQFACPEAVNTDVVSEKVIALSDDPAIVVTVPLKFPAIEPNEPAPVLNVGAADAVIILFVFLLRYHQDFLLLQNSYH